MHLRCIYAEDTGLQTANYRNQPLDLLSLK